jgi:hypothetical protein
MATYQTSSVLTEILSAPQLSRRALGYFRARLKNRLHQLVLSEFLKREGNEGFNKADLARRIDKKPEQITRLLGAPGNWTLDTLSDLLLAMGYELEPQVAGFDDRGFHAVTSSAWPIGPLDIKLKEPTIKKMTTAASG